jgi:MFS transporter, FSR family, fosmidomycin resistance protein
VPIATFLAIELLDEVIFGAREAAWPLIRRDVHLTYVQIGLILAFPGVVGTVVEPVLALHSETGHRRRIVVVGGIALSLGLVAFALSPAFGGLLAAACLLSAASGAFVSLAQATWMDLEPTATELNMARWVVAGSVGALTGPLVLAAVVAIGGGWRVVFLGLAACAALATMPAWRLGYPAPRPDARTFRGAARRAIRSLQSDVVRWLVVLECTDLAQDVFLGFAALYLVDVAGTSIATAGAGVAIWTASALVGDLALVRVLRRVDGVRYLRSSAALMMVAYPAFLLVGAPEGKLALLVPLGILRAGWYGIPKGRLYAALPGRGGTAVAVSNVSSAVGWLLPIGVAAAAQRIGLGPAMWLLLAAPLCLLSPLLRARRRGATGAPIGG